jgi:hypothetical protein
MESALNRIADATFALNGTVLFIGIMFLLFKKMSGHDKVTVKKDDNELDKVDGGK